LSTLSSASICWKTTFEVISLKPSGSGGRFHCWSFSVFFVFNASMSCVICSSVFSNWLGPDWLGLNDPLTFMTGGPRVVSPFSILSFFAERGEALTRLFEASARARFAGAFVTGPTIVRDVKGCQHTKQPQKMCCRVVVGASSVVEQTRRVPLRAT